MPVADGMWDVDVPINATFDELHVVLGQSAGFIREHILHLKKKTTGVFVKIIFIYLFITVSITVSKVNFCQQNCQQSRRG